MNCGAIAKINLEALQRNLQQVRKLAPSSKIIAMIKSNGYGHGLLHVAKALNDVDAFGVACLGEGLLLRQAGIKKRTVLLRGFNDATELTQIMKHDLDTVIHNQEQLQVLAQTKLDKPIAIWLKIDTGMHRLGFLPEEITTVYQQLQQNPKIQQPFQIMTHFADADNAAKDTTNNQLAVFAQLTNHMPEPKSIANSAGIINWPEAHADWIRPGIMLYGVSPLADKSGLDLNLKPVMTLQSSLINIKQLKKGDYVGYGGTWQCPEAMQVGVVAIGYGDGYPRHAQNGTPVLINDQECPLIGCVSMDMLTVDLRNNSTAKCGDIVTLWGEDLPVERIATYADTISYELLCGITTRVQCYY